MIATGGKETTGIATGGVMMIGVEVTTLGAEEMTETETGVEATSSAVEKSGTGVERTGKEVIANVTEIKVGTVMKSPKRRKNADPRAPKGHRNQSADPNGMRYLRTLLLPWPSLQCR